mmetsp:Transcript_31503/g.94642  ORF Transcript_31503/g.94642 Transcript_31503/m.94642 type:complete len:223 (+) Transcript_31503:3178-3846(+)
MEHTEHTIKSSISFSSDIWHLRHFAGSNVPVPSLAVLSTASRSWAGTSESCDPERSSSLSSTTSSSPSGSPIVTDADRSGSSSSRLAARPTWIGDTAADVLELGSHVLGSSFPRLILSTSMSAACGASAAAPVSSFAAGEALFRDFNGSGVLVTGFESGAASSESAAGPACGASSSKTFRASIAAARFLASMSARYAEMRRATSEGSAPTGGRTNQFGAGEM